MNNNSNNSVVITEKVTVETFAEVIINGQSKGTRRINGGPSLKEFATSLAQEYGIRSFNITVDGSPVTSTTQASAPLKAGSKVAVQASDSRGGAGTLTDPTDPCDEPDEMTATTDENEMGVDVREEEHTDAD